MSDIKLIVGLGNPGKEYDNTRHNVGFEVIDELAKRLFVDVKQKKFGSLFAQTEFEGKKLILLKPQTYMNRSGQAVATAKGFYKLDDADILVVVDDTALEPGVIRVRAKGSAGGHNGLRDIIQMSYSYLLFYVFLVYQVLFSSHLYNQLTLLEKKPILLNSLSNTQWVRRVLPSSERSRSVRM